MSYVQPTAPMYRDDNGPPPPSFDDYRMEKLRAFCTRHEIASQSVIKLRQLEQFDIVCVCDDSGSMNTPIDQDLSDPYAKQMTRWDELCKAMILIIDLATCLDKDGVDIYFFNRAPLLNVTTVEQVRHYFLEPPQGYTPTTRTLQYVFQEKARALAEGKVLCILATDGQPTDENGNIQLQEFVNFIKHRPPKVHMSIVAFTDDESSVEYLDGFIENNYPNVDVTEDYRSERKEVKEKTGKNLSFGDYVVKIMLGGIDPSLGDKGLFAKPSQPNNGGPSSGSIGCICCKC